MKYATYDVVVIALLSAVSAVAYVMLAYVWTALTAAMGPLGGALLGMFQFGHLLAFAILRKPGVTFLTSVLTTIGQLLLGDPSGAYVLAWGVVHGAAAEAVFAAWRYRSASFLTLALAGGLAGACGQVVSFFVFGWQDALSLFYLSLPVLFVSSGLESGALAYGISRAVVRSQIKSEY